MKSFQETVAIRIVRLKKWVLNRSVRHLLLRLPGLPQGLARTLDDIRFVEPDVLRLISNTVGPGWKCADVGAHCGTITVRLAKLVGRNGRVLAFEPIESNRCLLERRIVDDGLGEVCRVLPFAIGAENRDTTMIRGDHSTTWKITEEAGNDPTHCLVECRTFDSILEEGEGMDFVKVDIEGAEVDLVAGAGRVIRDIRPLWLFEMHNEASWSLLEKFFDNAYRAFDLSGREIRSGQSAHMGYGHIVVCPSEKVGLLG